MSDLDLIRALRELLGPNGERWDRDRCENASGQRCLPLALDAARWTLWGADALVQEDMERDPHRLARVLGFNDLADVQQWSRSPRRTWQEVDALLAAAERRLILKAKPPENHL